MGEIVKKWHFGSPQINNITKASRLLTSNHPMLTLFKYRLNTYSFILDLK